MAAIRFEQELADAYFPTSESRKGLGKAVTASMIDPTVKAIVGTGDLLTCTMGKNACTAHLRKGVGTN